MLPEEESMEYIQRNIFLLTSLVTMLLQGTLMELSQSRRGEYIDLKYLTPTRSTIIYEMPLAEVMIK